MRDSVKARVVEAVDARRDQLLGLARAILHHPAMTRDAYLAQARSLLREERYRAEA